MKKHLLFTIPVLILAILMVTTTHAWLATALCQRIGNDNTASGNAGGFGLQNGYVQAEVEVNNFRRNTKYFYQYGTSTSAYDDGPSSYSGFASGRVWGWNPSLQQYSTMYRSHSN